MAHPTQLAVRVCNAHRAFPRWALGFRSFATHARSFLTGACATCAAPRSLNHINGGGVRGLSALLILEEVMKRIQHLENLELTPSPHQYFDLIAGTGTGAVQACMLGRLRMPVHSAIESYTNLAKDAFSKRKWFGSGRFKTTKLKNSLVKIIRNATGNPEEPLIEDQKTRAHCKTVVFAMSRHDMRAGIPTAFRSYPAVASEGPRCTIWETLCATMAHPDMFKSFDISGPMLKQSFVDAGLGCNNPLAHVLAEVKSLYPERHVSSVISIGTGHTRTIQIPDRSILRQLLPKATIKAMKYIAEDAERVAQVIARRFGSVDGIYFRLSVDQGLQSVEADKWDQLSEVAEHTRAYMRTWEVKQTLDKAAEAVRLRRETVSTVQIGKVTFIYYRISSSSSPTRRWRDPSRSGQHYCYIRDAPLPGSDARVHWLRAQAA
ncbi:unnamed protein product [Rhizoctonia solani]|uniref:PNPLA domain-containing protein n=1 Tax=Rhizoctonia solani TaxID=456999 RepID=A0A8H3GH44_9AGAM|nr:unnamed protein product [Rhizoctonia solani]